jgi:hypothetical protein
MLGALIPAEGVQGIFILLADFSGSCKGPTLVLSGCGSWSVRGVQPIGLGAE